jgi:hypothetical protein
LVASQNHIIILTYIAILTVKLTVILNHQHTLYS